MGFIMYIVILTFSIDAFWCEQMNYKFTLRDKSDLKMLPLGEHHVTDGVLDCAITCSHSINNTCTNFMFDDVSRACYLGTWILPKDAVITSVPQPPAETKLYTRGGYCDTVGNGRMGSCSTSVCTEQKILRKRTGVLIDPAIYRSCVDVKNSTNPRQLLQLSSGLVVMCDTVTDGGGWTIFQRRVSGVVDFYRNWEEYKHGFGDFDAGEFYLGNENIYCLTFNESYELRIDMTFRGKSHYAAYSSFQLQSEREFYKLLVSGYYGNAGDALTAHSGRYFSTYDKDKDTGATNCAVAYHGAWWYTNCHISNLNGKYGSVVFGRGLTWINTTTHTTILDSTEMKFRLV